MFLPSSLSCAAFAPYYNVSKIHNRLGAKSFGRPSMNLKVVSLTAIVAAAFIPPAVPHPSFAMFDAEKTVTLQGTVKEFGWGNPHSCLRVMANHEQTTS